MIAVTLRRIAAVESAPIKLVSIVTAVAAPAATVVRLAAQTVNAAPVTVRRPDRANN